MTSAIQILWKQALKTFGSRRKAGYKLYQQNFDNLWSLINKITAEDVKVDKQILDFVKTQSAPMCVIVVFENKDMTIAIFMLKHGVTMPMHDHPGMHGFLKVHSLHILYMQIFKFINTAIFFISIYLPIFRVKISLSII